MNLIVAFPKSSEVRQLHVRESGKPDRTEVVGPDASSVSLTVCDGAGVTLELVGSGGRWIKTFTANGTFPPPVPGDMNVI
jgi:hypothetical protein